MSIFDNVFKKKQDESDVGFDKMLNLLTNLTEEDIQNIKDIASGNYNRVQPISNGFMSAVDRVFNNTISFGDNSPQSRKTLYNIYDEMDEEVSYISAALDILSDDATQSDEEGRIIQVFSESSKVKSIIDDFIVDLSIEERLPKWARVVAKYGDYFLKLDYEDGKGVTKILDTIYPSDIQRFDFDGELVAFSDNRGMIQDNICAPWDFVHFKHKGDITASNKDTSNRFLNSEDETHDLTTSYGQSTLKPAVKVYAQLRFVENMILLSRLTNSVRRNIFMINVGDVAPDKSFETISNYANLLKKNIDFDLENGVFNSQKKTISYDEDIFIPVSDPKNDVRIEQVGGDVNIDEQYDLEYLLNKLFSALKIPKAYLNYEQDLNARSTLIQLDIRYARSVSGLQQTLRGGLLRLFYIHLAMKGLDPGQVDLDIQLTPVSTIDEEGKRQDTLGKIEVANSMWRTIVDVNQALSKPDQPANPFAGMVTENVDPDDNKNNSIDMNYAAELIFSDYLGFSPDEVNRLFGKSNKGNEETISSEDNIKTIKFRRKKSSDPDLLALYPTKEGNANFKRLREKLTTNVVEEEKDL